MGNSVNRVLTGAGMALICVLCGWRSARLGLGITPDSAAYHFQAWKAKPELSSELDRAITLNPRYTAAWIARGLKSEAAGDRKTAEASLLQAASTDRTYLPAWTLANFYLRSEKPEQFWSWVRQAAGIAHDPTALFQLCWRFSSDSREILDRAIPPERRVQRAYLHFLLATDRFEAAGPLAGELSRAPQEADRETLLAYCDTALARGEGSEAMGVWNALLKQRLLPYLEAALLTNGDLAAAPLGRGFDWRSVTVSGASTSFDPGAKEMTVSLSGRQPESTNLAQQYLVLQPDSTYRFRFHYRSSGLPMENGLLWSFVDANSGAEFASLSAPATASDQAIEFSAPPGCGLARVVLRYRHLPGRMRDEGSVVFHHFTLEPLKEKI